jgi:hypothetical protein
MDEQPSSDDLREFLKSLTAHEVEYLLIGGFAVALHGYPRARLRARSQRLGRSCAWAIRRCASS